MKMSMLASETFLKAKEPEYKNDVYEQNELTDDLAVRDIDFCFDGVNDSVRRGFVTGKV